MAATKNQPVVMRREGDMTVYKCTLPSSTATTEALISITGRDVSCDPAMLATMPRDTKGGDTELCVFPIEKFVTPQEIPALLMSRGLSPVNGDAIVFVDVNIKCFGTERPVFGQWKSAGVHGYIALFRTFDGAKFGPRRIDSYCDEVGWEPGWHAMGIRKPKP